MRALFRGEKGTLNARKLVFIDEAGFRLGTTQRYGARRGEKCYGNTSIGSWSNVTMLGALAYDGSRGFMTYEGATTSEVFAAFISQQVVPKLKKGDVLVMDNLQGHKSEEVMNDVTKKGASILFLPPYSPDLNPIEKLWSYKKQLLRRAKTKTKELLDETLKTIMNELDKKKKHFKAWIQHAGYRVD